MGISMGLMLGTLRRGVAAVVIAADTFTRADSAVSIGSTESGSAGVLVWTVIGTGTYGISGNQAYPVAPVANDIIVVNTGVADGTLSHTIVGGITYTGFSFRAVDGANYYRLYCDGVNINLEKVVAGVPTFLGASAQPIAGDIISIVLAGNAITVKKNGVQIIAANDAFNNGATRHGLHIAAGNAAVRWDNFQMTA